MWNRIYFKTVLITFDQINASLLNTILPKKIWAQTFEQCILVQRYIMTLFN